MGSKDVGCESDSTKFKSMMWRRQFLMVVSAMVIQKDSDSNIDSLACALVSQQSSGMRILMIVESALRRLWDGLTRSHDPLKLCLSGPLRRMSAHKRWARRMLISFQPSGVWPLSGYGWKALVESFLLMCRWRYLVEKWEFCDASKKWEFCDASKISKQVWW